MLTSLLKLMNRVINCFDTLSLFWHVFSITLCKALFLFSFIGVKVKRGTIIFESFHGRSASDSPYAIYKFLMSKCQGKDFRYIWVLDSTEHEMYQCLSNNPKTRVVIRNSIEYFKAYKSSQIWISNCRLSKFIRKSKRQTYIQCWHGTPIKKLGCDIIATQDTSIALPARHYIYSQQAASIDIFLSPSRYATDKFISAFSLSPEQVLEKGYPRSDALVNGIPSSRIRSVKQQLNIPEGKKIILYAPTYRDNIFSDENRPDENTRNLEKILDLVSKASGGAIVLYRGHYFTDDFFGDDRVIDVSRFNDVNEILSITDVLITDYSSLIFDFSLLERAIICYVYDEERYINSVRGSYLNIDDHFPCLRATDEVELKYTLSLALMDNRINSSKFSEFNSKYNSYEDGKSCERVVKKVLELANML